MIVLARISLGWFEWVWSWSIGNATQAFAQMIRDWVKFQFDPSVIVDAAMAVLGMFLALLGSLLPAPLDEVLTGLGTLLQTELFSKIWNLGLYFITPVCEPIVINLCVSTIVVVWAVSLTLKCIILLWGYVWSGSA